MGGYYSTGGSVNISGSAKSCLAFRCAFSRANENAFNGRKSMRYVPVFSKLHKYGNGI